VTARLPIRWKLTLWYALLLAAALLFFGLLLYFGVKRTLYENFEEQVRNEAAFALSGVSLREGSLEIAPDAVARLEDDDHYVRLVDAGGAALLDTSEGLGGIPADPEAIAAALEGETGFTTYHGAAEPLGIVTTPVTINDEIVGVLEVGSSRGDTDEVLRTILLALVIAGPLALTAASAGGYFLAGRALAPVVTITRMAAELETDDLTKRLDLPLPDDELGRLAQTFDAMLGRVESSFERQRQFTTDAAHELRTPLAAMRGEIDLALARPRGEAEYRQALQGLDEDVERMSRLTATLLTLARSDAGQMALDRRPVDLADMVRGALGRYASRAEREGMNLVDETSPVRCAVDSDLMGQLLANLLDNAFAHTPGRGRIAAGCVAAGAEARVWVEDSGSGIPTEHQDRVFDRFYRVDAGRVRESGGTGLGLAIVKAIAEAHGGRLALTSEAGAGTRVEIAIPC
jgi:heavy metal sensor kinase